MGEFLSHNGSEFSKPKITEVADDPKTKIVENPSKAQFMAEAEKPYRDDATEIKTTVGEEPMSKERSLLEKMTDPMGNKLRERKHEWFEDTQEKKEAAYQLVKDGEKKGEQAGHLYDQYGEKARDLEGKPAQEYTYMKPEKRWAESALAEKGNVSYLDKPDVPAAEKDQGKE